MPYQKVLIAVDNSEMTAKVIEQGAKLSSRLDAMAGVVFVVDTSKVNKDSESGSLPEDLITKLKREADKRIDHLTQEFPDCAFEKFILEGKPSKEIIKVASDWKADLIVMGTQGKTGLKRLLVGSTAENTLRSSNIPILIVPAKG